MPDGVMKSSGWRKNKMAKKKFGKLKVTVFRLCSAFLVLTLVFGLCGTFATEVKAASDGMTDAPQYINPSITTTIRNLGPDEVDDYVLAFTNGNEHRKDGTNSVYNSNNETISLDANPPVMKKTLSESGYPQLEKNDRGENVATMIDKYGSNTLEDIFNASSATGTASKTYTAENTPFNYDEDTYSYVLNSADNHVYFNEKTNKFQIYEEPLRPYHITTNYGYDTFGAFLPFNSIENAIKISDSSGNKVSGVTYGGDDGVSWKEEATHAANLYATPATGDNIADNWFVMKVEFSFYIPKDGMITTKDGKQVPMVFEFSGDDDVWVYIDDVLVIDQGGTHKHTNSKIDFTDGKVEYQHYYAEGQTKPTNENDRNYQAWPWPYTETTIKKCFEEAGVETGFKGESLADYTVHTLTFFFMERGGEASNCKLSFNMPIVPKGALSVQKSVDGIVTEEAEKQEYTFILKDSVGTALSNTDFSVIKTDGTLGEGSTNEKGEFKLKANEQAVFEKIEGGQDYSVVQVTEKDDAVYDAYSSSTKCTINGVNTGTETDDGLSTGNFEVKYDKDNQTNIIFTNTMKQDKELTVTKKTGSYISDNQEFSFSAKIEGIANPVTFTLKNNGTYTLTDIPAGADVTITETVPEGMEASSAVSGSDVTGNEKIKVSNVTTKDGVVVFTNEMELFDVTVNKLIDGSLGNKAKQFDFTVKVEYGDYSDNIIKTHEFQLTNEENWKLEGIPYGAKVTISENAQDYTPTLIVGSTSTEGKNSYDITKLTADTTVTFENVKDGSPNTGVSLDSIPYIIILALTLAGAAAFVIRRRRVEIEQ